MSFFKNTTATATHQPALMADSVPGWLLVFGVTSTVHGYTDVFLFMRMKLCLFTSWLLRFI
jgi:hypothetical protein